MPTAIDTLTVSTVDVQTYIPSPANDFSERGTARVYPLPTP